MLFRLNEYCKLHALMPHGELLYDYMSKYIKFYFIRIRKV